MARFELFKVDGPREFTGHDLHECVSNEVYSYDGGIRTMLGHPRTEMSMGRLMRWSRMKRTTAAAAAAGDEFEPAEIAVPVGKQRMAVRVLETGRSS